MQSRKTKKLIIANSLLLTFLAVGFAYAWFAANYRSSVDSDQVEVIADSALEISFTGEDGTWKNYLNLADSNSGITWSNLEFKDITGSGDGTFFRPTLSQFDGYAQVDTDTPLTTLDASSINKDYIKFDLYMRSTDKLNVYLGDGSQVQPLAADGRTNNNLIGPYADATAQDLYHKSSYGDFSKDIVAGAVRVSASNPTYDTSIDHIFTWIPRPNIYLDLATNAALPADKTYKELLKTDASSSDTYTNGNPYVHTYYASAGATNTTDLESDKTVTGDIVKNSSGTGSFDTNKAKLKLSTLAVPKGNNYYQEKVTIYIWLEGCDNEARRAFVGGKFKVSLGLTAEDYIATDTP